jgi:hypothetical protein
MVLKPLILLVSTVSVLATSVLAQEPPAPSLPERSPRVLFIVQQGSEESTRELVRLRAPGGVFDELTRAGWKIGPRPESHLQIVDSSQVPDLIARWEIREYPTVLTIEREDIVRSFKEGCSTPLDSYTFTWLLTGISAPSGPSSVSAITVPTSGSYPLRGNHWNFEGNWNPGHQYMVSHLRGPAHASLYPRSWPVEGWSDEELRSLHDDLHEMGRPRLPLNGTLEPGNSVRPGEVVPIYRPANSGSFAPPTQARSSSQNAGSTSAAARASSRPSGSSRTSGGGFF